MRRQGLRQAVMVALVLVASVMWLTWLKGSADGVQAAPVSFASPEATARWRYAPVPPADVAAVQQSYTKFGVRYREYQHVWQAYVTQLHHCQTRPLAVCASGPQHAHCQDQLLMQCLGKVIPALDMTRGALHDQAIGLQQATQQIVGETE